MISLEDAFMGSGSPVATLNIARRLIRKRPPASILQCPHARAEIRTTLLKLVVHDDRLDRDDSDHQSFVVEVCRTLLELELLSFPVSPSLSSSEQTLITPSAPAQQTDDDDTKNFRKEDTAEDGSDTVTPNFLVLFNMNTGICELKSSSASNHHHHHISAQECFEASTAQQTIALCSAPCTLTPLRMTTTASMFTAPVTAAALQTTTTKYFVRATVTACVSLMFHVTAGTTAFQVTCASSSTSDLDHTFVDTSMMTTNTPIVIRLFDGEDKTSVMPNLDLVIGPALARKCVWVTPERDLCITVQNGFIQGHTVHILHLACARSDVTQTAWRSNFTGIPTFASATTSALSDSD